MNALNWIQFGIEIVMACYISMLWNQRHVLEQDVANFEWMASIELRNTEDPEVSS